jgi:hypothetical protein
MTLFDVSPDAAHDALSAIQSVKPLILAGKIRPLSKNQTSGIAKSCIPGPWTISTTGLVCAAQADLENHSGAEKALLHDPFDHYEAWRRDMGAHPLLEISCDRGSSPPSPSPLPASGKSAMPAKIVTILACGGR